MSLLKRVDQTFCKVHRQGVWIKTATNRDNLGTSRPVSPSVIEEKYIFDTRDSATLDKGVALRVNADGTMTLLVQDDTTTSSVVSTTIPAWVSGKVSEVVAEWSNVRPLMRISVDGAIVIEDTTTALPDNLEDFNISSIQLGANALVMGNLDSEFIRAVFLKRPR